MRRPERGDRGEPDDDRGPEPQQQPESRPRVLAGLPERSREPPGQHQRPGQEAEERQAEKAERPQGRLLLESQTRTCEDLEMVVDDHVPQEARGPPFHQEIPGHRDRGGDENAPPRDPRAHWPLAREPEEDGDHRHDAERVQEIAREHGEAEARIEDEEPAPAAAEVREHEPGPRERDPEHEQEIGSSGAAVDEHAEIRGDHEPSE